MCGFLQLFSLSRCFGFDRALMFLNPNNYKRSLFQRRQESTQLVVPWEDEENGSDFDPSPVPA